MKRDTNQNNLTRREMLGILGGGLATFPFLKYLPTANAKIIENEAALWNKDWDKALLRAAINRFEPNFDVTESLLRAKLGNEYRYQTYLRNQTVHITRDSLEYAILLLEEGSAASQNTAFKIIERMISLQNTDSKSKFFGLWGYYAEEPAEKMLNADFNWADFIGAWLLMIQYRYKAVLPKQLNDKLPESIRLAAESVKRRNVSPYYTNIAFQGNFVLTCAAELLNDKDLLRHSIERWKNLARTIDETGSLTEYNSPTYNWVTIENVMRTKMFVKNPEVLQLNEKLHRRIWEHLAAHFHTPTAQFAAPMSRCYTTDLGSPLWLQKALGGKLQFLSLEEIQSGKIAAQQGETVIIPYNCPLDLREKFFTLDKSHQHREIFLIGKKQIDNPAIEEGIKERQKEVRPMQGTTFFTPKYALGSANRSDFWVQRRPLGLYWGDDSRPARYLQLRLVKDEYDFASGLFYSVQNENCVLAAVNFRTPGGDRHPTIDTLVNGEFEAERIYLQFLMSNLKSDAKILINGEPLDKFTTFPKPDETRFAVETETCRFIIEPRLAQFGKNKPTIRFAPINLEQKQFALEIDVFGQREKRKENWATIGEALIVFTLTVESLDRDKDLNAFDNRIKQQKFKQKSEPSAICFGWQSSAGKLELGVSNKVQNIMAQDAVFEEKLNGANVPLVRLSEAKIFA